MGDIEYLEGIIQREHEKQLTKLLGARTLYCAGDRHDDCEGRIGLAGKDNRPFCECDCHNPFLAEPGTHPHDGTTQYYQCECSFCKPPARQIGGWVHRAAFGTLPTFATHQSAFAYLPEKTR